MTGPLLVEGATALLRGGATSDARLFVEHGRIGAIGPTATVQTTVDATVDAPVEAPAGARRIDGTGLLLAPGLIELQLNGGFGHDFTADPESIWEVGARLPASGVTAFLPTIVSCPAATIR